MSTEGAEIKARRVEVFSAGCRVCQRTIGELREWIDPRHPVSVLDMNDKGVADRAAKLGIRTVPAVAVDGALLKCCKNTGPTLEELRAAGVAKA